MLACNLSQRNQIGIDVVAVVGLSELTAKLGLTALFFRRATYYSHSPWRGKKKGERGVRPRDDAHQIDFVFFKGFKWQEKGATYGGAQMLWVAQEIRCLNIRPLIARLGNSGGDTVVIKLLSQATP